MNLNIKTVLKCAGIHPLGRARAGWRRAPSDRGPTSGRVYIRTPKADVTRTGSYLLARSTETLAESRGARHGEWTWWKVEQALEHLPLYRLTVGDAREAARVISRHQDIAADSCFSDIFSKKRNV